MRFLPAPLDGLLVIETEPVSDERGHFARVWDAKTFALAGLSGVIDLCCVSRNAIAGTLRGMHWQVAPHEETKIVRCTRGRVFDVAIDVRDGSASRLSWWGTELDPTTGQGLYIPPGFAHGFLTLEDDSEVEYLMTSTYSPAHSRGIRYDDPSVGIIWPTPIRCVSDGDLSFAPAVP